jgi:hypothetical protein
MNYTGQFRTNAFTVRDPDAFSKWVKRILNVELERHDEDGSFTLYQSRSSDWPGIPSIIVPEGHEDGSYDTLDYEEMDVVDFCGMLAAHLVPDPTNVAIVMEAGHEGLRYLTGRAVALRSPELGEPWSATVNLDDIYVKAQSTWALPDEPNRAEY